MGIYEIFVLGSPTDRESTRLVEILGEMIGEFDLKIGAELQIIKGDGISERDIHAASACVYFAGPNNVEVDQAAALLEARIPIIPTVQHEHDFDQCVPHILKSLNGLRRSPGEGGLIEIGTALLECIGLLRQQRRVFVSYRRIESRSAAVQMHDVLSSKGFDVFLDTHDIRPGAKFQDVLWHRLCDSDVMIMLDTPTYFDNKWTREEIGRARAKEIHILRVVWPDHTPSKFTDLAETIRLGPGDLEGPHGPIVDAVVSNITIATERLRSRSIAARYMSITGRLRAEVERTGMTVEGIGAHRAISLRLLDDRKIWAYPIVGIPTADLLNDIADKAKRSNHEEAPVLVYDHVGIRDQWSAHLQWLDDNISVVRSLKVGEAGWRLAAWDA